MFEEFDVSISYLHKYDLEPPFFLFYSDDLENRLELQVHRPHWESISTFVPEPRRAVRSWLIGLEVSAQSHTRRKKFQGERSPVRCDIGLGILRNEVCRLGDGASRVVVKGPWLGRRVRDHSVDDPCVLAQRSFPTPFPFLPFSLGYGSLPL